MLYLIVFLYYIFSFLLDIVTDLKYLVSSLKLCILHT